MDPLTWWNSLSPWIREWTIKITVTIALALAWHWTQLGGPPNRNVTNNSRSRSHTTQQQPPGVSRRTLNPLPQDLVLEEKVEVEKSQPQQLINVEEDFNGPYKGKAKADEDDTSSLSLDKNDPTNNNKNIHNEAEKEDDHENNEVKQSPKAKPKRRPTTIAEDTFTGGRTLVTPTPHDIAASSSSRPLFQNTCRDHPGLQAFWYWCDVECSLFRIYNLGRKDGGTLPPPLLPNSRRGKVQVLIHCRNRTNRTILVYWVNYKGRDEFKGKIKPNASWSQISWMEHPWIFKDEVTDAVLLYYVPDRIIPTCKEMTTVDDENDSELGIHRFDLVTAPPESIYWVHIDDPVLPFPAHDHITTITQATDWALLHMHRMNYSHWHVLTKYLSNILQQPANANVRRIRIANPTFYQAVWNTPAQGLLLAMGFVQQGAYVELGTARMLTKEQVKQLSSLMFSIAMWRKKQEESLPGQQQPQGADGYGRAGFGRVGSMN